MLNVWKNHRVWVVMGIVLLSTVSDSDAGRHRRRGGSSGMYGGSYGGYGGGSSGMYGGYGGGWGGSSGMYGGGYMGGSSGMYGGGYIGGYGGYMGGSSGMYGGGSSGGYGGAVVPGTYGPGIPAPAAPAAAPVPMTSTRSGRAQLVMEVPQDAKVYLVHQQMQLSGTTRKFSTPAIQVGKQYEIPIRVEVTRDGKTYEVEAKQLIEAGQTVKVVVNVRDNGELQVANNVLAAN